MSGLNLRWRYKKRWHVSCPDHTPPTEEWDLMAQKGTGENWSFTEEACEVCGQGGEDTARGWQVPEKRKRDSSTTSRLARGIKYD